MWRICWGLLFMLTVFLSGCGKEGGLPSSSLPGLPSADEPVTSPVQLDDRDVASPFPTDPFPVDHSTPSVPYAPQPADADLLRGNVYLDSAQLLVKESYPPQVALSLRGSLPTPCHTLRVAVNPPNDLHQILVEVYSVVKADILCIEVLAPFDLQVQLGHFPEGHYTVLVNGKAVGEFDS